MQDKKMYPQAVVTLLEKPSSKLRVLFDNGQEGYLNMLDAKGKELPQKEIDKFFVDKAELFVKDNNVRKTKEKLQSDKEFMKKLSNDIISNNPDIVSDPLEMMSEVNKKVEEEAYNIVKESNLIKKGSLIRVAGITKEIDGEIYLNSRCILYNSKDKTPSMSGVYMYAVNSNKIPLKSVQTDNGYTRFKLSSQATDEQINNYFDHNLNTLNEFKEGNIKSKSLPNIKTKSTKDYKSLPLVIQKAITTINNKDSDIDSLIGSIKEMQKFILEDKSILDKIDYNIPIIEKNVDLGEIKNLTTTALLNTTFRQQKQKSEMMDTGIDVQKIIEEEFDNLVKAGGMEFNTTYTPPNSNCGFFSNNLNQQYILPTDGYDKLINSVNLTLLNLENKDKENENLDKEKVVDKKEEVKKADVKIDDSDKDEIPF